MEGGAAAACQLASNDGDKSVDNDSEPEQEPALAPRLPSNDSVQRFAAGVAVDQKNKSTTRSVDANGAAYDWNGKEWTPGSVFVATDDALNTILQRKATFDLGSSSVGEGRSKVKLHKNGWMTELEGKQRESIHSRLTKINDELKALAEGQTHIKSCYVRGKLGGKEEWWRNLGGIEWDSAWISSHDDHVDAELFRENSDGPWLLLVRNREFRSRVSSFGLLVAFARGTHVSRSRVYFTRKPAIIQKWDCD